MTNNPQKFTSQKVKISVIIPIFNVEVYISRCLESILNQTLRDIEIICIDDCGADDSMQIVNTYLIEDSRIKIVRHHHNMGLGCARNTGVQEASGKYIACIDSDDWILPEMLERTYLKLEETGFDSVWVKVNTFLELEGRYTTDNYYKFLFEQKEGVIELTPQSINDYPVNAWNKVYRKDFIKNNNLKWSEGLLYEDLEFYYAFYTKSTKTYLIDYLCYIYRWRPGSIMNETDAGRKRCEDIYEVTYNIYAYLSREKIFDHYKISYLELMARNINLYLNNPHYHERVINASKRLLVRVSYQKNYANDDHELLASLKVFDEQYIETRPIKKWLHKLLINLIPVKSVRKTLRSRLKNQTTL